MADLTQALYGLNFAGTDSAFGIGQQALAQATPQLINPYGSTGQALGISLGSVLLQSLLGYQAQKSAMEDTLATNKLANAMLQLQTPEERTSFIETQATDPRIATRLSSLATALTGQQLARQQLIDQELAKQEALGQFELGPIGSKLYQREINKALQLANARRGVTSGAATPAVSLPGTVGKPLEVSTDESLSSRRDALIQYATSKLGMTPNRALDYAEKNLAFDTKSVKTASDKIEKSRERAALFSEITARANEGVAGAGMTGGAFGAPRQAASRLAAALGVSEQQLKQDAQKVLDSVKPDIVKIGRSPGAITEKENAMLIGAGPSSNNTPSENKRLIANMEFIKDMEGEYADYVEAYVQKNGTAIGADRLWAKYKEEEALKENKPNPNRVSIYDYLSENNVKSQNLPISAKEQKLLDAGFVKGPGGGWIKP